MKLETERLILRSLTAADAEPLHQHLYSNPAVMQHWPEQEPQPLEYVRQVIDVLGKQECDYGYGMYAVLTRAEGTVIGLCGMHRLDETGEVELAYALGQPYWGGGLITEAARAAVRYAFETLRLDALVAVTTTENASSQRVMEKIGLLHDGLSDRYYGVTLVIHRLRRDQWQPDLSQSYRLVEGTRSMG